MRKFYQTERFRRLESIWRKKLEDSGFEDLEDARGNLKQHDRRTIAWDNRARISTFFSLLGEYLSTESGLPARDRRILELYSEGVPTVGPNGIASRLRIGKSTVKECVSKHKAIIVRQFR